MPSAEFIKSRNTRYESTVSNHLGVFLLFVCPSCKRYTIHRPRLNRKGYWYVDHKLVPVHQLSFDGEKKYVGLAPADSCFVDDNIAIMKIKTTRTVIRVK